MAYSTKIDLTHECNHLLKTARSAPMLEREEELSLARRWRDNRDEAALNQLVNSYLRLVISVADRFRHHGLPIPDLVQEGTVGLMEAVSRFNPERGIRFSTYSRWWIRSSIQDYVLRNWSIVRTGTTAAQKSLFFNLRRLRSRIEGEIDGPLSASSRHDIARQLNVRVVDVEIMEGRMFWPDRSLNARLAEASDTEWQELIPCERALPEDSVTDYHDDATRGAVIADAMSELTPREQTIIRARCLEDKVTTLAQLGQRLGISKERVRQLESQALNKMKSAIIQAVGDPTVAGLIGTT